MSEKALSKEDYATFGGMTSAVDPHDVQVGQATVQINVTAVRPGEANVRKGLKVVEFEEE